MLKLLAFLALSLSANAQIVQQIVMTPAPMSGPCVAPASLVARWTPTSGCSTSTNCATDQVAGNNATQTSGGALPTYSATGGPNATPSLTFNGTSDFLNLGTAIPSGLTTLTFYAIINLSTSQVNPMFGAGNNGLTFRTDASSNTPDLEEGGIQGVAGSQSLSLSTWYTVVVTYDNGTTTTSFYSAAGGVLGAQGSATSPTFSWSSTTPWLGKDNFGGFFAGSIAEWGYSNVVNTAGIANWSHCNYGV